MPVVGGLVGEGLTKLICVTGAPAAASTERCDPMVTFCDEIARHRVQTPGH